MIIDVFASDAKEFQDSPAPESYIKSWHWIGQHEVTGSAGARTLGQNLARYSRLIMLFNARTGRLLGRFDRNGGSH